MQTVFRNPLAGPSVLGISNGSALGVAFVVLLSGKLGGVALSRLGYLGDAAMSVAAIVGALAVMMLILWVAQKVKGNVTLLIIGVMIGYLANAIIGVLKFLAPEEDVKSFVVWGLGSFSRPYAGHRLLWRPGGHRYSLLWSYHVHRTGRSPSGSCHLPYFRPSHPDACHHALWSGVGVGLQFHCPYAWLRGRPACEQRHSPCGSTCDSSSTLPSTQRRSWRIITRFS